MSRDCEIYQEKLSAYIDGQLSVEDAAALEAHIDGCSECATLLERMKQLGEMATGVLQDIDDQVLNKLEKRIADNLESLPEKRIETKPRKSKITPIWYKPVAVAATVILVFSVGYFALDESNRPLWDAPSSPPPVFAPEEPAVEDDDFQILDQNQAGQEAEPVRMRSTERVPEKQSTDQPVRSKIETKRGVEKPKAVGIPQPIEQQIEDASVESGRVTSTASQSMEEEIKETVNAVQQKMQDSRADKEENAGVRGETSKKREEKGDKYKIDGVEAFNDSPPQKSGKQMAAFAFRDESEEEFTALTEIYSSVVAEFRPPKDDSLMFNAEMSSKDSMAVYWYVVFDRLYEAALPGETGLSVRNYYIAARGNYDLYRITEEESFFNRAEDIRETALLMIEKHLVDYPDDVKILGYQNEIKTWQIKK